MMEIIINHVDRRTEERTCIGKAVIDNDGTGGAHFGNYDFFYGEPGEDEDTSTWRRVKIRGFERKKRNVWDLLYLALRQARSNRNR